MKYQLKNLHFWAVLAFDLLLLVSAHLLAYAIRFGGELSPTEWTNIRYVLPFFMLLKLSTFFAFGLYRGMWRYTSLLDLLNILKACLLTSLVAISAVLLLNRFESFSRAIFVLDGVLTFLFITSHRIAIRLYYQKAIRFSFGRPDTSEKKSRKKLLIIGAGAAAEKTIREINDSGLLPYDVVGLLDDNPAKKSKRMHGIAVLGPINNLLEIAETVEADEVLIAIPSASREQMSRIVELCQAGSLPFKTLPSISEIIDGQVNLKAIREVSYSDLLGRPQVHLELNRIRNILSGKTIMVTGAGGSIGSELCRQILRFNPGKLILFDAGEYNLYQVEMEIRHEHEFTNYVAVLGKVQNEGLLNDVFQHYKPQVVFHAAAYKHVPLIEQNPWEAVYNNILASKCLMETAIRHAVERFILVSTDKAVRPTNVMGASKRVTELLMQAYCTNGADLKEQNVKSGCTRFMAVRFGNVLGSSGSVIPLFKRQIELGGPVTVTDPEITRFFMSIEEAAQLILQACSLEDGPLGEKTRSPENVITGGEIFILEMGTPVKIAQMARDLIKLCGKQPDTEIKIKYTGLRPGEKLYEELITQGEGIVPTRHEKIMVLMPDSTLEKESPHSPGTRPLSPLADLNRRIDELESLAQAHDAEGIKQKLKEIVIDYSPGTSDAIL